MSCSFFTVWMSPSPLFSFLIWTHPPLLLLSRLSLHYISMLFCASLQHPPPFCPLPPCLHQSVEILDTGGSPPCHLQPYRCRPSMASHENGNQIILISLVPSIFFFESINFTAYSNQPWKYCCKWHIIWACPKAGTDMFPKTDAMAFFSHHVWNALTKIIFLTNSLFIYSV